MVEVGVAEAQRSLSTLIEQVQQGTEILLLCEGTPVARIVAPESPRVPFTNEQRAAAFEAAKQIREHAKTLPKEPFVWEEMKKDLGRKD